MDARAAFAASALAAVLVDALVFRAMHPSLETLGAAHMAGYFAGLATLAALLAILDRRVRALPLPRLAALAIVALLVLFLRGGLLASCVQVLHLGMNAAHLVAAIANGLILEFYHQSTDPMWGRIYRNTLRLNDDGTVSPPDVPGLGADPNYEALAPYRIA